MLLLILWYYLYSPRQYLKIYFTFIFRLLINHVHFHCIFKQNLIYMLFWSIITKIDVVFILIGTQMLRNLFPIFIIKHISLMGD